MIIAEFQIYFYHWALKIHDLQSAITGILQPFIK